MKRPLEVVVFDLDDTLIDTSIVFVRAREEFVAMMGQAGYAKRAALRQLDDAEWHNLHHFGYVSERNLVSMREAYEALVEKDGNLFSADVLRQISSIAGRCLYKLPRPLPYARTLLSWCARKYRLALLTRGSEALQYAKIDKLGVRDLFHTIHVVKLKTPDSFRGVLRSMKCHPQNAVSVGDSPRFDILNALRAGMSAIHVQYPFRKLQWNLDHENTPALHGKRFRTAKNLREVKTMLQRDDKVGNI
jgi:putative hydrolase of the HAD superfamily